MGSYAYLGNITKVNEMFAAQMNQPQFCLLSINLKMLAHINAYINKDIHDKKHINELKEIILDLYDDLPKYKVQPSRTTFDLIVYMSSIIKDESILYHVLQTLHSMVQPRRTYLSRDIDNENYFTPTSRTFGAFAWPYLLRNEGHKIEEILTNIKCDFPRLKYRRDWIDMEKLFARNGSIDAFIYSFHQDLYKELNDLECNDLLRPLYATKYVEKNSIN